MRITIWNEGIHESEDGSVAAGLYPDGMHAAMTRLPGFSLGCTREWASSRCTPPITPNHSHG